MNDVDAKDKHVIGGPPAGAVFEGVIYEPPKEHYVETCERCSQPFYIGPKLKCVMVALEAMEDPYVKLCFNCCAALKDDIPGHIQSMGGQSGKYSPVNTSNN